MKASVRIFASAAAVAALVLSGHAQTPNPGQDSSGAGRAPSSAVPDIAGVWKLNPELSDKAPAAPGGQDPRSGDADGGGRGRGGGGWGGPGGGGRGGYGGGRGGGMRGGGMGGPGGGQQRDPEQMKRTREFMQAVLTAPAGLTIVQRQAEISMTDDQGQVTKLATDGKEEKHVFGSETGKTKTKWNGQDLVMEIAGPNDRPKLTRTYTLVEGEEGAKQLRVVSKMEGDRGPRGGMTVTQVYEPATP